MTKRRKQTILGCVLLIVVVALLALAYFHFSPIIREGQKQITVNVVTGGKGETQLSFKTSEKYLRKALESQKLISGKESTYGLYVQTVNGITADESIQQWWLFTKNGQDVLTGVDSTPIADGDIIAITLKTGW